MEKTLLQELKTYEKTNAYPFHMPGHKRKSLEIGEPAKIDITEIDGFDNLHHPEGILKESMEGAAKLWGAEDSFFLVNGSSGGILAALSAAVPFGAQILVARNCHKAVYHAIYLRHLRPVYLFPEETALGLQGCISPKQVALALEENPEIQAVFLTSPTYDGVVSDITSIADIAHSHGVPLVVDEAHGAHFGFSKAFPDTALHCGADVVIQSLHKTLPSLTQTAILHRRGNLVKKEEVQRFLGIYQTSSPSYVFMASMDRCVTLLQEQREELFASYESLLQDFYESTKTLKHLHVVRKEDFTQREAYDFDFGKLLIMTGDTGITGVELAERLRETYHLEMEMAATTYVTAMTSIYDFPEGFQRLLQALHELDRELEAGKKMPMLPVSLYRAREKTLEIYESEDAVKTTVPLQEAAGCVSGEYIYLYPPGIPLVTPGEILEGDLLQKIVNLKKKGYEVQGPLDASLSALNVVK